jgi:hypothetical protein
MTTFHFSIVPPALQMPTYLNQGFDPHVTPENEHMLDFAITPPALETRPSVTCLNWEINPCVAPETAEGMFINSPVLGTAEESGEEREHPTTSIAKDPTTSQRKGSFFSDQKGIYNLEWPDVAEFDAWHQEIKIPNSIKFKRSTIKWARTSLWTCMRLFVCGRRDTGKHDYTKTDPNRKVIESKKIECPCQFIIKEYPHTNIILGRHLDQMHNHPLGKENI